MSFIDQLCFMKNTTTETKKAGITNFVAAFILLWMTITVPLYVENRYFNILQAKGHAFGVGCIAGALLIAFSVLSNKYAAKLKPKASLTDAGMMILAYTAMVSCLLSGSFKTAFWGEQGWCVGGFAFLMAAFLYLYLSKSFYISQNVWLPVIAANGFIFVIGLLHSVGIDALGLHKNIDPNQFYQYISTIGNVNWFVGYLCLLMPMLACFYIESKSPVSQIIYLVILILGELNMVLTGSDGLYLGIGVCAFFAAPYMFRSRSSAARTSILVLIYGVALAVVAVSPVFADKRGMIDGLSGIFLKPAVFAAVIAIGVTGVLVFSLIKEAAAKKLCRVIVIAFEVCLGAAVLFFVVKTVNTFDRFWGSDRGGIWIWSVELFRTLEPMQKIFGVGPEMLGPYYAELPLGFSRRVLAAHSEPLQILLSMGIAGIAGWLLMWAGVIKRFFSRKLWKSPAMAFCLPLMAYLGQSLVNTPMATNVGILIIMVSLFVYNSERELK